MSIKGVHWGLRLPLRMEATSDARCPTLLPLASTTYHFRLPARSLPLGKYVDIVNYLCFQRIKRERLEYLRPRKVVKATTAAHSTKRPFDMTSKGLGFRTDLENRLRLVGFGWLRG